MSELLSRMQRSTTSQLALCVAGIMGSLILYSLLQERIMTIPYGHEKEVFSSSLFVVLCNRLCSCMLAAVILMVKGEGLKMAALPQQYAAVSLSNVAATTCQYDALKYVSFPVQTLGKCAKMIPVMIWGRLIMQKRYSLREYALAGLVTAGTALFLLSGPVTSKRSSSLRESSLWGLALMLGYLGCDGFTSTFQDRLFKRTRAMSTFNQMLYTNLFSAAISLTGLVAQGQIWTATAFLQRHPQALAAILALSAAATVGQLFIIHTIKAFGALTFATVMTTRQFVSILLSCALFAHPLTLGQWAGTALVFGALYYKVAEKGFFAQEPPKRSDPQKPSKQLAAAEAAPAEELPATPLLKAEQLRST